MGMGFGSSSSEGIPLETVDEDKASKYRRWFPMFINPQPAQLDWPSGGFLDVVRFSHISLSHLSFSFLTGLFVHLLFGFSFHVFGFLICSCAVVDSQYFHSRF